MNNIYPIVVPAAYFDLPPEIANPGRDAWGIVRPLGNDLFSLLVQVNGDIIKNVHDDDLAKLRLDRAGAERAALHNLSALAESGTSIQRQVTKTDSGFHFAVWLGDRLTSSCILWPGLYEWARRELETDQIVVSAPQVQLMCVAARGDSEFRSAIKGYMDKVVSDMEKQISTAWFELSPNGIAPLQGD
ncbi:MAG: hypothetical protein ACHRHE_06340 [Tepidisphaerales bacterium]